MTAKKKQPLPKWSRMSKLSTGIPVRVDLQARASPEYEAREGFLFFNVVAQLADEDGSPCCEPTPDGMRCSRRDGLPHQSTGVGLSVPASALAAYGKEWLEEEIEKKVAEATQQLENYRASVRLAKEIRES